MTLPRIFWVFSLFGILFLMNPLPTSAVTTSIWEQSQQEDFESGTPKDVSVTSKGEVALSPELKPFFADAQEVYIWCLAEDSQGNIYAGTGNQGKIYRVTPEGESSLFYNSPEISILSLAVDADDNLYAGTAPDGLIYKITGEGAPPQTILSSEEKYVWAMTFDDAGNLYAATGTDGKIYKITPDGESSVLFDSEESNILCLLAHQGALYAGSDGNGVIYRITTDGTPSVIYQTGQREVHTLALGTDGMIYAGTVTSAPPKPGAPPSPNATPPPGGGPPEEKESKIYQIRPDGVVTGIWTAPEPLILSMVVLSKDELLVGTGDDGKIYRVNLDGDSVLLGKCEASQILAMHRTTDANKLLLATGNSGKIFALQSAYIAEGTLESEVNDTRGTSRWGKLSWEGVTPEETAISFAVRTGNTETPDNTWSDWSEALTAPQGSQITNPSARYIQWRATLTTSAPAQTPVLKKVTVASVQANVEPRLTSIEISRGTGSNRPEAASRGGARESRSPSSSDANETNYTITWKAEDANGDTLQYAIYYKSVDETNWKLLKDELNQTSYTLDSLSIPDGRYTIKIDATDKLSNPPGLAASTEKISDPVDIDNTSPTVANITATANEDGTYRITAAVEDQSSYIQNAVYKIDSDEHWQAIFPADGIFDSKHEDLLLQTGTLPSSAHTITIQATDAAGNTAVGRGIF